ncbi:hypothetical protein [Aquimonas sp.]|uniref:hypothetical protein n=1 Tax=Aquimonas sp. TaxID=1872588 RepID=UPI0037BF1F2C
MLRDQPGRRRWLHSGTGRTGFGFHLQPIELRRRLLADGFGLRRVTLQFAGILAAIGEGFWRLHTRALADAELLMRDGFE